MTDRFGLTQRERDTILTVLQNYANRIEQVSVFGSRAQGKQKHHSDLDLVVYGDTDEALCDRLWTLFQESNLPFSVDVKSYVNTTYPPLRQHIDTVACPLLIKQGQVFVFNNDNELRDHK